MSFGPLGTIRWKLNSLQPSGASLPPLHNPSSILSLFYGHVSAWDTPPHSEQHPSPSSEGSVPPTPRAGKMASLFSS